jgi:voltage-gated potassium channel
MAVTSRDDQESTVQAGAAEAKAGAVDRLLEYAQRFEQSPFHSGLIAIGVAAMTGFSVTIGPSFRSEFLHTILWGCIAVFAAEAAAHTIVASREKSLPRHLASMPFAADIAAVLPVPVALLSGIGPGTAWLFGSLWLFKLPSVGPGLARLGRVISLEAKQLTSVLVLFVMVWLFAAMALHLLEGARQPAFATMPGSLWWAVVTLTTTGYGDVVPVTPLGRLVAATVMICGLGVFGLLTGILATGFVDDNRRETFVQNWSLVKKVPFFSILEPAALIELARLLRRWDVSRGTTVIRKGRTGDCMYFVAAGAVQVEVDPPVRLGPGAFFGEMALLGDGVRNATVTTAAPSILLILDAADFRAFTAHHPALAEAVEAEAKRRKV